MTGQREDIRVLHVDDVAGETVFEVGYSTSAEGPVSG